MDALTEALTRGIEQLLGRAGGPLHLRLVIMPVVVSFLAIRAGIRDARRGQSAFLWELVSVKSERRRLLRSALQDIGRLILTASVLDTSYQLAVLRAFYPLQLVLMVVALAVLPYVLLRGPVTRLARRKAARERR